MLNQQMKHARGLVQSKTIPCTIRTEKVLDGADPREQETYFGFLSASSFAVWPRSIYLARTAAVAGYALSPSVWERSREHSCWACLACPQVRPRP
jgi:hypothetical protein